MEQFHVTGMSCAACSARVEKAVSRVEGVSSCSVSLLMNSMQVEGNASPESIIAAVQQAGYGAELKRTGSRTPAGEGRDQQGRGTGSRAPAGSGEYAPDEETLKMKRRLIASLCFLAPLMYVSMGHTMLGWPLPSFFDGNPAAAGLLQLLLAGSVMVINQKFFISGGKGLLHGAPNMDTLVAMGSATSFLYSVYILFAMTGAQAQGETEAAVHYLHEFYFESAAMILTLITVGKMLETRAKGKTTDALKSLMKLSPETAVVIRDGKETEVPVGQVRVGDLFAVKPGEIIPVDGIVREGSSAVNEAALTGESIPADKTVGDSVYAACMNQSGYLKCEALRTGEDTTLSQIIRMVSDAAATKAPAAKLADRVSGIFVPAVIAVAAVTTVIWLIAGKDAGFALARGISVLVISCPCALGLATPVAIMTGSGAGAKNGILFKTAASLEETGKTQIVVLDKTGTVTSGEMRVTDILPADGFTAEELLQLACVLEKKSEHPLAEAILKKGEEQGIHEEGAQDFRITAGSGLTGTWQGRSLAGGNEKFAGTKCRITEDLRQKAAALAEQGKTPVCFSCDGKAAGIIAIADTIREDSPAAVRELQNMGIRVVLLTGDHEKTARAVGKEAGVDQVIAEVRPDEKEQIVRLLTEKGRTAMVGDGINDAPALTRADTGIAIGAGTDIAIDAADVVLMKSRLSDVPAAIRLSRAVLRNIKENLFWAFFYNVIGIPLAAGFYYPLFGWKLSPMFGAAAMSISSFCVVSNALRLNIFRMYDAGKDRKHRTGPDREIRIPFIKEKENQTMEKTMEIKGMMCMHCEARVKKTLEALDGVVEAVVSHEAGTAVVKMNTEIADEILKNAVEAQDYEVTAIHA